MGTLIGIDLGTTNSCVAYWEGTEAEVLENAEGNRTTPSVVAWTDQEKLVGDIAKRQAVANPDRTVSSIKRFMGRRLEEVGEEEKIVSYDLVPGPNGDARVRIGSEEISPAEISAELLRKLKSDAEQKLGVEIEGAVVTVPAYFNDDQRQATKDAGRIAGLEIRRIINEPTAAALAYGVGTRAGETVLVFDLGGGTLDVSVLEISDGVFEVLATSGDNHLGGDNWDKAIVDWMLASFSREHGIDLSQDKNALQRLYEAAERAKKELSSTQKARISLPFLSANQSGPLHWEGELSQAEFLRITDYLLRRIEAPLRQAIQDAGASVDHVILVGGMTRMPAVRQRLEQIIGLEPRHDVHPDEVVALGAAIQAAALGGQMSELLLLDVTPLSLGVETRGGIMARLIDRNTTIPTRRSQTFSTAEDNQSLVEIHVLQGESDMAASNKSLGRLQLRDIPPARRGEPQIEVEFDIDVDGLLNVQAHSEGRTEKLVVEGGSGLQEEEVQEMIQRAKQGAERDRLAREQAERENLRESYLYAAERQLAETSGLPSAIRAEIEADLQILRTAPSDEIENRVQDLRQSFLRLSRLAESAAPVRSEDEKKG